MSNPKNPQYDRKDVVDPNPEEWGSVTHAFIPINPDGSGLLIDLAAHRITRSDGLVAHITPEGGQLVSFETDPETMYEATPVAPVEEDE